MSIERAATSAKLSAENFEFLQDRKWSLRPYEVSISSLLNLCVRIVRELHARGDLSLEPEQLQKLLATADRSEILAMTSRSKKGKSFRPGSPSFPPPKKDRR
jgi:hypothetical protein